MRACEIYHVFRSHSERITFGVILFAIATFLVFPRQPVSADQVSIGIFAIADPLNGIEAKDVSGQHYWLSAKPLLAIHRSSVAQVLIRETLLEDPGRNLCVPNFSLWARLDGAAKRALANLSHALPGRTIAIVHEGQVLGLDRLQRSLGQELYLGATESYPEAKRFAESISDRIQSRVEPFWLHEGSAGTLLTK